MRTKAHRDTCLFVCWAKRTKQTMATKGHAGHAIQSEPQS